MPGADDASFFDAAAIEASAGMGAGVVGDIDLAAIEKYGQLEAPDLDVLSPALLQFVQITQAGPRHNRV